MANELLKFKKGEVGKLPTAISAGTIYVTTDEHAMYVDVDNSTRIRLGDFIRVAKISDIKFPYSETALYYVEEDNALVCYQNGSWKQINSFAELAGRVTSLESAVQEAQTDIGNLETRAGNLETRATALEAAVGKAAEGENAATGLYAEIAANAGDIEALKTAIGMDDEGNVEGLDGRVNALESWKTSAAASIEDYGTRIGDLETASAQHATKTELQTAQTTLQGNIDTLTGNVYTKTQVNDIKTELVTKIENADNAINSSLGDLANRVTALDTNGTGKVPVLEGKVSTLEGKVNTIETTYATKTEAQGYANAVLGTSADESTANTVYGAKAAAAEALAAAQAAAESAGSKVTEETLANAIKDFATSTAVATAKQEAIDAAAEDAAKKYATIETVNGVSGNVTTAQNRADAAYALAEAAVTTETLNNAIKDFATDAEVDAAKQEAITAAAEDAAKKYATVGALEGVSTTATAAKNAAEANADLIETQGEDIATIKGDYLKAADLATAKNELTAYIDTEIDAANAMTYQGTVSDVDDLPPTASIGDTYVVEATFKLNGLDVYAGDMLIAQPKEGVEEVDGVLAEGTFDWKRVQTGYASALDPNLSVADNTIKLSSLDTDNGDLGTVIFEAEGAAAVKTVDNKIVVGTYWEDFA